MGETNRKTLDTYGLAAADYIANSPQTVEGYLQQWIDACFVDIPQDAPILEVGSGGGRDADYLEGNLGFTNLDRSDASPAFVEHLRGRTEQGAAQLNVLEDEIATGKYRVIFADAVMLHFDDQELPIALENIYRGLQDGGEFFFTTARPAGEVSASEWSNNKLGMDRYFNRLRESTLRQQLEMAGFAADDTVVLTDLSGKWYHVATRKVVA